MTSIACCGHALTRRHRVWSTLLGSAGAALARCASTRGREAIVGGNYLRIFEASTG